MGSHVEELCKLFALQKKRLGYGLGRGFGVLRLDSALWQARLDECGAEPSGWRGMRCVGWVAV